MKTMSGLDGGWGWMVVVGSFFCYFIADGWAYSFGIIFSELLEYFGDSKALTATIGALIYAVPFLLSPVSCSLCSLFGCRPVAIAGGIICSLSFFASVFVASLEALIFTLGFGVGVGLSLTYVSSIFAVTYYFEKRRGLAIGLAVTGSGIGAFVYPFVIEKFLDEYFWKGTLLLLAGLSLHIIAAGCLFFPLPQLKPQDVDVSLLKQPDTSDEPLVRTTETNKLCTEFKLLKHSILDVSLYKNWKFICLSFNSLLCYVWIGTPYVYLGDKVKTMGFSEHDGVWLFSTIGISRTVGQIMLGFLADFKFVNEVLLYAFCILMCGVSTALLPLCSTFFHFQAYSVVFGYFVSATYSVQMLCVIRICGLDKASNAFGVLQLLQGLATLLGTPIPGES